MFRDWNHRKSHLVHWLDAFSANDCLNLNAALALNTCSIVKHLKSHLAVFFTMIMRHISTQFDAQHVCNNNKRRNCIRWFRLSFCVNPICRRQLTLPQSTSILCSNQFNCNFCTFLFPKTFRKDKQMTEHEDRKSLKAYSVLRAFRNCFVVCRLFALFPLSVVCFFAKFFAHKYWAWARFADSSTHQFSW